MIGKSAILFFVCASSALAQQPSLPGGAAERIRQMIDDDEVRAVSIGMLRDGESAFVNFGSVGHGDEGPPTPDTVFEIGSISKVFTALLTEVQVRAGHLSWDAPISDYLPDVAFQSESVAAITLRELATHTSGLPRLPDNMRFDDPSDPYAGYAREHLLQFLANYQPTGLEKVYSYSNLGAGLLGLIAADAAGMPYAAAMEHDVLAPLGLGDTSVGHAAARRSRTATGFSAGADMPDWGGFDALAGAGALTSTARDMLRFVQLSLDGKALDGATGSIQALQGDGPTAFGWHVSEEDGGDMVVWHNGGTGGFASFVALRPAAHSGVVLLTTGTAYDRVTELGFELATGAMQPRPTGDLSGYAGAYRLAEGFVLTISAKNGELFGQATGQAAFPLAPVGPDRFAFEAAGITIEFLPADDGRFSSMRFVQAGRETIASRVDDADGVARYREIEVQPTALADYVGRYLLAPGAVLSVDARGGQLYAALTGQPEYPVFPYAADAFFYKVVDAQLAFERADDGTVSAVVLHQAGERRAPRIE